MSNEGVCGKKKYTITTHEITCSHSFELYPTKSRCDQSRSIALT